MTQTNKEHFEFWIEVKKLGTLLAEIEEWGRFDWMQETLGDCNCVNLGPIAKTLSSNKDIHECLKNMKKHLDVIMKEKKK